MVDKSQRMSQLKRFNFVLLPIVCLQTRFKASSVSVVVVLLPFFTSIQEFEVIRMTMGKKALRLTHGRARVSCMTRHAKRVTNLQICAYLLGKTRTDKIRCLGLCFKQCAI